MSHCRLKLVDGVEFWIVCKRLAFLSSFSHRQVIQNKRRRKWQLDDIWAIFGPVKNAEKKNLGRLWTTFEGIFCFKLSLAFVLKGCIRSLLYIFFIFFLDQNRLNIHNQLCLGLLETPFCATSIVWWLCGQDKHIYEEPSKLSATKEGNTCNLFTTSELTKY